MVAVFVPSHEYRDGVLKGLNFARQPSTMIEVLIFHGVLAFAFGFGVLGGDEHHGMGSGMGSSLITWVEQRSVVHDSMIGLILVLFEAFADMIKYICQFHH